MDIKSLSLFLFLCVLGSYMSQPTLFKVKVIQEASISPIGGIDFKVEEPLIAKIDDEIFIVPQGFETDLASIPRWLWAIIAPNESAYVFPSILHDYLYAFPGQHTRQYADNTFYSFLIYNGVPKWKAFQFYLAVRIFGASHYRRGIE